MEIWEDQGSCGGSLDSPHTTHHRHHLHRAFCNAQAGPGCRFPMWRVSGSNSQKQNGKPLLSVSAHGTIGNNIENNHSHKSAD